MRQIPDTPAAGIVLMTAAMIIAPWMDVFSKILTQTVSPGQAALGRFVAQTLILVVVVTLARQWIRPGPLHALAGMLLGLAILCINGALQVMPVANAIAIFFVEPLILTLLSAYLLGEGLGWRRLLAVVVGLAGAMIVLRPNVAAFGWAAALPLGTAVFFAFYLLLTRVMTRKGGLWGLQFWTGGFAALTLAIGMGIATPAGIPILSYGPFGWREVALMLAVGAIACAAHQLLAQAFRRAEAGALAPLQYLEIISAVVVGWLVFGDFPDALTWLGTAIIIAAGVYVFHRERQIERRER